MEQRSRLDGLSLPFGSVLLSFLTNSIDDLRARSQGLRRIRGVSPRPVARIVEARATSAGAGVLLKRILESAALDQLDPSLRNAKGDCGSA